MFCVCIFFSFNAKRLQVATEKMEWKIDSKIFNELVRDSCHNASSLTSALATQRHDVESKHGTSIWTNENQFKIFPIPFGCGMLTTETRKFDATVDFDSRQSLVIVLLSQTTYACGGQRHIHLYSLSSNMNRHRWTIFNIWTSAWCRLPFIPIQQRTVTYK